jgi:hypothetical protein
MDSVFQTNDQFSPSVNQVRTVPFKGRSISAIAAKRGYDSASGLSAMLLAAMVSALVVVADLLIGTWADGHLMLAWIALWTVGFATLAVFGGPARKLALTSLSALDAWSERIAQERADKRLWLIAQSDARVMADLKAAMRRGER